MFSALTILFILLTLHILLMSNNKLYFCSIKCCFFQFPNLLTLHYYYYYYLLPDFRDTKLKCQ